MTQVTATVDHKWLTVAEYAEVMRLHPRSVYRLIQRGRLGHTRAGRAIRIPEPVTQATEGETS